MRVEKEIRFNEWLLGSTILCQSCGCLWLVPAAQHQDRYICRQCGSEVTSKAIIRADQQSKTSHRERLSLRSARQKQQSSGSCDTA
jgi:ribosomal protein S27AE